MALKKRKQGQNEQYSEFKIEFVPVIEEESEFQKRKEIVQLMITDMILRSKKRGRPRNNEEEFQNAA
ncbi:MAG: hypothetical protein A2504_17815 [Bdellovibrionales bacterium RIFOXYD12_FULL_39_22]|nr:MAG: hypothetical protein A2385_15155 [Bdellovibrionales bacterium RIFOXYB1_FULL_39_21]OFZ48559.1 MAG: hypothetical protein A2404_17460 [Bdellovibrionales bacterium RIFOXYC1_FULL_39_130]OFZ76660.1 MAG: hypothetical protein A2560_04825 [Bdellovibrionales bacterium RIFOXYD1_FULL_39_84]OFZ95877.1 MAG: hypothetical protein A2504_17815 [Bdellovibrionales bacterium RIFOXYD12_FULL_39_22]HLE12135.1 hypothetical protein [Bacteriovoracaceae bacterium]